MLRSIMIAAAAAGLLAVGALTAVAATSHGKPVSDLARSTTLSGAAKGDAVKTLASTKSDAAKNHATAAHENGKNKVNHGGAVSAVARNHD